MKKGLLALKRAPAVFLPVVAVAANSMTGFAAETGGSSVMDNTAASMISSITDMASSVGSAINSISPAAINIVGIVLIVLLVLKCFEEWVKPH